MQTVTDDHPVHYGYLNVRGQLDSLPLDSSANDRLLSGSMMLTLIPSDFNHSSAPSIHLGHHQCTTKPHVTIYLQDVSITNPDTKQKLPHCQC